MANILLWLVLFSTFQYSYASILKRNYTKRIKSKCINDIVCELKCSGCSENDNTCIQNNCQTKVDACPGTCYHSLCDEKTRVCSEGCITGFYGDKCNSLCSQSCKNRVCLRGNGRCEGCVDGWFGETCDKRCSWCTSTCNQNDGNCDAGPTKAPNSNNTKKSVFSCQYRSTGYWAGNTGTNSNINIFVKKYNPRLFADTSYDNDWIIYIAVFGLLFLILVLVLMCFLCSRSQCFCNGYSSIN